jgi:DNA-binding IclR family transcriptional regulator
MPRKGVDAVERALSILGAFTADDTELTLAQLAVRTGLYKSTILRLAVSLERFGFLVRGEQAMYRLGPALWRLGSIYRNNLDLGAAIRPELRRLVETTGETASFYVRDKDARICLFRHNSLHAARHHLDEGTHLSMTTGASAHVLLAFDSPKGSKLGTKTRAVRDLGYAISLGERDPDVAAVAVPLFDGATHFRGALSISGLINRFGEKQRQAALKELAVSAKRLAAVLPASE